ncbi:hypothetical protein EYF80_040502 [Liparis tanakae]|uniref:Uncharacterized protein n=1 Tax=Liparis tanakae TaxID=230148 RepID=A0A4Z2G700_9TELE|nr:hypothetical protein EYF80_040502 [Liparis tanakae]
MNSPHDASRKRAPRQRSVHEAAPIGPDPSQANFLQAPPRRGGHIHTAGATLLTPPDPCTVDLKDPVVLGLVGEQHKLDAQQGDEDEGGPHGPHVEAGLGLVRHPQLGDEDADDVQQEEEIHLEPKRHRWARRREKLGSVGEF